MRILVDENIPRKTVTWLREQGHDVHDLRGTMREGLEDPAVWGAALKEQRLLISTDKGFAKHRGEPHYGILIVRLRQPNRLRIHQRIVEALGLIPEDEWPSLLVTMRDTLHVLWRPQL